MKATLEFNLPEEYHDHLLASQAGVMAGLVLDADEQMRNWLKHGYSKEFDTVDGALEACRVLLREAVEIANGE